jgi:methylphosphotriester-DNA--protein-cysteine methyltransferase
MVEDFERCYLAVQSRDPRFDGWFYTAVTSTRIYCRPSCPAHDANAQERSLLPVGGRGTTRGVSRVQAMSPRRLSRFTGVELARGRGRLERCVSLRTDSSTARASTVLALQVGYSVRQLERVLQNEIGAGPIAIARAQRAQTARILIETTGLVDDRRCVRRGIFERAPVQRHGAGRYSRRRPRCCDRGSKGSRGIGRRVRPRFNCVSPFASRSVLTICSAIYRQRRYRASKRSSGQTYRRTLRLVPRSRHRRTDTNARVHQLSRCT